MRKLSITTAAALFAGVLTSSATVTVQGWWHLDSTQPISDSSANSRTFGSAYSTAPTAGGSVAAQVINNGAGGPLDGTGYSSTQCIRVGVGVGGKRQSSMWSLGYNPPAQNFGIEAWVMPQDNGIAGGSGGWILSSGQSGGVALRVNSNVNGNYIDAFLLGTAYTVGERVPIDTNRWMHLALVNDNGITTFYTNGVPCGQSDTNNALASAGDVYAISAPGDNQAFYGYMDELRMFTFAAGAFTTNDLLLRPPGPNVIASPQSATVWSGGAAPFDVIASFDSSVTYQWQRGGANLAGQTKPSLRLSPVTTTDNGSQFSCVLTRSGISVTSSVATLSVVAANAANVNAYRNLVKAEPSLVAYYPIDGNTGAVVTNTVDPTYNGMLEGNASYDGRTNRAFGERSLLMDGDGDVSIPADPAMSFATDGTIEALVYMSHATVDDANIFAVGNDPNYFYYRVLVGANGGSLIYTNGIEQLTWAVAPSLVGRMAHVAFVIDHLTNVTAYVNGQSLGTKQQSSFGYYPNTPGWIGSVSTNYGGLWAGNIDELAVYGSALPAATIQTHYTKYYFGTNVAPPSIVSQSTGPKSLYAGGSPILSVTANGALPLSYQWTSNNVPITGATGTTLTLAQTKTSYSASYAVTVTNVFGSVSSQPIALTFVAPPTGYVATVMGDGPTAFWRLADTGSVAMDSAGGNDANYSSSGVTYGAGGFAGDPTAGARFNGSTGRAVTSGNVPALNPKGPFTIEFWGSLTTYGFYVPLSSMDRPARTSGYEFYLAGNSPGYEYHTAEAGGYSLITADNNVPPNGVWSHVVGIWDGTNMYLYINGQLGNYQIDPPAPAGTDNFTAEGLGQTEFIPNTSFPFFIACRSDNTHYYNGTLCDIALYSYALSPAQVSNHWSYGWVPSAMTQQPVGVTNVEGSTITLTAKASGVPNTYQWYKGATALTAANNFDGTLHYPQGVNSDTLVIAQAVPADSGLYHLAVVNPVVGTNSANANVVVTPDTNRPAVAWIAGLATPNAYGPTPFLVKVLFNKRVDPATAGDPGNYVFSGGVTVSTVTVLQDTALAMLGGDWRAVFLATSGLTPGQKYSVTVSNVKDQTQTPNTIVPVASWFRAPVLSAGQLDWDYYYLKTSSGGNPISDLTGNSNYPNAPGTNANLTIFDSSQFTGGDLNNKGFGALGDNYGASVSGWVTPTVTGDYTFFLASDDASELWLSTSADPAAAVQIAYDLSCCHGFQEKTNTNVTFTSDPIHLTANTPYFIRALQTEGNGGDYVKVAWRLSTDSTPAASLLPIPSPYLSGYAQVPPPKFNPAVFSGGKLTLTWSGTATLLESTDLKTWTPVQGNPTSGYQITPSEPHKFYRLMN